MNVQYRSLIQELWCGKNGGLYHEEPVYINGTQPLLWAVQLETSSETPGALVLPDLQAYLIAWRNRSNELFVRLVGPRTYAITVRRAARRVTRIFAINPFWLATASSTSVKDWVNRSEAYDSVFPESKTTWSDSASTMLFELNRTLSRICSQMNPHTTRQQMLTSAFQDSSSVSSVAQQLGIAERTLYKYAQYYFGNTPKEVLRILRLSKSLNQRVIHPNHNWSAIAYAANYFDQSHMISEYQHYLHRTPAALFDRSDFS